MNAAITTTLAAQLEQLLETQADSLRQWEQVSEKGRGSSRLTTYRLALSSGRLLKARCYRQPEVMQRNLDLRASFDLPGYPAPVAHAGLLMLEPWILGHPLEPSASTPAQLATAGQLLARLHTAPCPAHFGDRLAGVQARLARLEQRLDHLAFSALLTETQAASLLHLARTTAPRRHERGIVHRDFRPENLLWSENTLTCIDLDTLDFGPYEEDLARVWLLWPLPDAARQAFWQGYALHRDPASFLDHFAFWAIYSAVNCLQYRLQAQHYDWEIPLEQLRELAALDPTFTPSQLTLT